MRRLLNLYFKNYDGLSKNIYMGLLGIFIYSLSFSTTVFLPLYLHNQLQHSLITTGLALSAFGAGGIIASYLGSKVCDHFQARYVTVFALILNIITVLVLYLFSLPYEVLIIFLVLAGISNATIIPANRIYLMRLSSVTEQGRVNGIRYMLFNIGCAVSLAISGSLIHKQYQIVFLINGMASLVAVLIFLIFTSADIVPCKPKLTDNSKLKTSNFFRLIFAYYFIGMLAFVQVNSGYTLYLFNHYHLSGYEISLIFLINSLLIALCQVIILNLFKNFSQPLIMTIGCFLIGFGLFIMLFGHSYILALLSTVIWTFGEMMFMPVSQNIVYRHAADHLKGHYMGIYQALYSTTLLLGPVYSTFLLRLDIQGTILWSSLLILCSIPLITYFFKRAHE